MLREWNVQFRALLDAAPDGIVVCDEHGRLIVVNGEAERMFGYAHDELLGRPLDTLIPEAIRPRHHGYFASYAAAPRLRPMGSSYDLHGLRKDGSEFPVEIGLSPFATERGTLIIAGVRDVSERRALERDNKRATAYLLSAVEAVQEAFLLFDENDRVMLVNSAARELVGSVGDAALIGRTFDDILRASLAAGTYDLGDEAPEAWYARRLAYHRAPSGTLDARTREGRHIRITERKTADQGTVTTIADITEDVRRADELRLARQQAEAASEAKSEFLSSMSHELRTPLNAILGFAQLLERDRKQPLSARQLDRLAHVLRGGEHLLRLIDDVLDLSRIEAGRVTVSIEPVKVADVLTEAIDTLEAMATRGGISIAADPSATAAPTVLADRTRLLQIVMNFGSNAIKYGKPGGHLTFRTDVIDDRVRVTAIDDGIGIPAEQRQRIFEPFQRAGQETGPIEGTGIGLTISKRLAELMRGTLGFRSEVGRGSEFWVELPVHREPALEAPGARAVANAATVLAQGEHRHLVIYVEDNPSNIAFMRDLVEDLASVELVTAPTAELGLELIRARLPAVVIMDINLPGISGFEAMRQLREWPETRAIPVVALSAAALTRDTARAEKAGFHRYLTKPVKVDELTGTLEALLAAADPRGRAP